MKCPRCESIVLEEHTRDGVVIDGCRECRGIWLDRGELEKLIARARHDEEERVWDRRGGEDDRLRSGDRERNRYGRDDDRRREDDRWNEDDDGRRGRRRGGFLDSLGDLFD